MKFKMRSKIVFLIVFFILLFFSISSCNSSNEPSEMISITYDYGNAGDPITIEIEKGKKTSKPELVEKNNYIFDNWYKDEEYVTKFNFNKKIYEDTTIYGKYTLDQDKINAILQAGGLKSHVGIKIEYFNRFLTRYSWGSGVILEMTDNRYYLLSNSHLSLPSYGFNNIRFFAYDYLGNCNVATLVFERSDYDLAIFECKPFGSDLEEIEFADGYNIGEDILSVGRPGGIPNTITYGVMSDYVIGPELSVDNTKSDVHFEVLAHSSYINLGSSGGALLNSDLKLVGINYAVKQDTDGNLFQEAYAIPLHRIYEFLDFYEEFKLTNAWLYSGIFLFLFHILN